MNNYASAINKLCPTAEFTIYKDDYSTLQWFDKIQIAPTEAAIIQQITLMDAADIASAYRQKRTMVYPSVSDQLDMLWHAIDTGTPLDKTSLFYTTISAIKTSIPKV